MEKEPVRIKGNNTNVCEEEMHSEDELVDE